MCPGPDNKIKSDDATAASEQQKINHAQSSVTAPRVFDSKQASDHLSDLIREKNIFLGGSSIGKGLKKAARYFLEQRDATAATPEFLQLDGSADLNPELDMNPKLEEAFYIVDIGVVISQFYQWRKCFPRVEPFYAVKCFPDPVIIRTLAILGANFDCASRTEFRMVHEITKDLEHKPDIIFANPCKPPAHLLEAVCSGIRKVTFDNVAEVKKCATISKNIELILRIITDDRGSQCRLSSKFGAPRNKWRPLLTAAKQAGLKVVGVSFHVGSGCRDASRYELALKDAREIFDMAKAEFGFDLTIIDIGGGFPGETHSLWNPAQLDDDEAEEKKDEAGPDDEEDEEEDDDESDRFMFFQEIAEHVAPIIDEMFPPETGVRVIGEPGRYMVAASSTLCCSVVSTRPNSVDENFVPEPISDKETAEALNDMSREDETEMVRKRSHSRGESLAQIGNDEIMESIMEGIQDYSKLFARQNLAQQEADVYNDSIDVYNAGYETATDLLGPPTEAQMSNQMHSVEGMNYPLVEVVEQDEKQDEQLSSLITLAAAGEAAVNGVVMQTLADSAPLMDDFSIYINDGVYGGFSNVPFDHATIRPRVLHGGRKVLVKNHRGMKLLESRGSDVGSGSDDQLYTTTVFGPTCDSIDVVARSVLLPKLNVGDWLYFQNMGAYSAAAASCFNGFMPSERFYVCGIKPEYFKDLLAGAETNVGANEV